jgi:putative hydrolase of the HAD superfamily
VKIKAVIFDLFGTLIENFSKHAYHQNLTEMAQILRLNPPDFIEKWTNIYPQRVLGFYHSPDGCIDFIAKELGQTIQPDQKLRASQLRYDFVKQMLNPSAETLAALRELKSRKIMLGLLSDCSTEIPELWPETPFAALFDTTTFSCIETARKPMPQVYMITAERLDVEPMECIFVGDGGSLELTGAGRIGMHPIRIQMKHSTPDPICIEPDPWVGTTIRTQMEVIQIIEQMQRAGSRV